MFRGGEEGVWDPKGSVSKVSRQDLPYRVPFCPTMVTLVVGGGGGTMGQVCFTAISSSRACPHGLHCSQFSVPDHVLCVRFPRAQGRGGGDGTRPQYPIVCLWRRLLASRHCSF